MRIGDLFEKWNLTGLKIKTPILKMDWAPSDVDKDAAWDFYIELLTRITTQRLPDEDGIESTALESVYQLFPLTRQTLKYHGRKAIGFSRIAIIVLNQIVRPFTTKWHRLSQHDGLKDFENCKKFREDLCELQIQLRNYTKMLAELAAVEDLTDMEPENDTC